MAGSPKRSGLSKKQAEALKPRLEAFLAASGAVERISFDPVEFPHRYRLPQDIEVVGLLSAALAYGRAELFKPKIARLLEPMGESPAAFVDALTVEGAKELLLGFVYRFNVATDVAVLLTGIGAARRAHGSLEALFLEGLKRGGSLQGALGYFTQTLRTAAPLKALRRALGRERGLNHLLPSSVGTGAAKRLNLYLRWMVRGPDPIDFGIWKRVPRHTLMIPLDTHIGRISRHLRLTGRKDLTWKTAEEITASLRLLDEDDPVRYDFALCHYGMSGACPATPRPLICVRCPLLPSCRVGPRTVARWKAGR